MVERDQADGKDDPRINCGGDCLWCQYGFEQDIPEDVRCTKPRGWVSPPPPNFRQRLRGAAFLYRITGPDAYPTGDRPSRLTRLRLAWDVLFGASMTVEDE